MEFILNVSFVILQVQPETALVPVPSATADVIPHLVTLFSERRRQEGFQGLLVVVLGVVGCEELAVAWVLLQLAVLDPAGEFDDFSLLFRTVQPVDTRAIDKCDATRIHALVAFACHPKDNTRRSRSRLRYCG